MRLPRILVLIICYLAQVPSSAGGVRMRHQDVLCDPLQGGCGTLSCAHAGCYEEAHFPCSCEQVKATQPCTRALCLRDPARLAQRQRQCTAHSTQHTSLSLMRICA